MCHHTTWFQFHLRRSHILNLSSYFTYCALDVICSVAVSTSKQQKNGISRKRRGNCTAQRSKGKTLARTNVRNDFCSHCTLEMPKSKQFVIFFCSDSFTSFCPVPLSVSVLLHILLFQLRTFRRRNNFFFLHHHLLLCFNLCFQDDTLMFFLSLSFGFLRFYFGSLNVFCSFYE